MDYRAFLIQKKALLQEWLSAKIKHWRETGFSRRHLAILFLFAAFLGAGAKLLAAQTFTIGFEDYLVKESPDRINLNGLSLIPTGSQTETRGPQCEE